MTVRQNRASSIPVTSCRKALPAAGIKSSVAVVLLILSCNLYSQDSYIVNWKYSGQTFSEFVTDAELHFPFRFLYDEEWVNNITLENYGDNPGLFLILDSISRKRSLYYHPTSRGNIVFTRDYKIRSLDEKSPGSDLHIPYEIYTENKGEIMTGQTTNLDIGNPSEKNKPGIATISGYISDTETSQPVAGATVHIAALSSGTLSNTYGYYALSLPRGTHTVKFSFIGMREKIYNLNVYSNGELNIQMQSVLVPLKGAVITAEKDIMFQRTETGVEKISVASLRMQPTAMGEPDILKSVLLVPGVNTVGEGSAGFNVRGGSADQNLILLYGAPIYNSSHFFGFFSAINPDIISDLTLYKGGIPSKYGGRLSSVIDLEPRDGSRKQFSGNAGISPVTAHIVAEGPLIKDTLSWLLAGRATYSDWILNILNDPALNNSDASFHDLNGRITWDINRKNKLDLSGYYSHDSFRFNSDTTYKYLNSIVAIRWRHFFSSRFFASVSVNNSYYQYNMLSNRVPSESFSLTHNIGSTGVKADFTWFAGRNDINFGTELTAYNVNPGKFLPYGDSSLVTTNIIEPEDAREAALYFEDRFILNDYLTLGGGLRFSSFFATGSQDIVLYDPDYPREPSSATDTISYADGSVYKTYAGPEFRLSANLRINRNNSLKLNYNRTRQYIHMLSNSAAISPTDTWKLSDYYLKPQTGDQYAAGFYHLFDNNKVEFSAETYYKIIKDMVEFKDGTELIMNGNIEQDLANVEGKAYGIELLLRKPEGRIRWNIGYTWSRSMLRSTGQFEEEKINSGEWFPANYDKPHEVVLSLNYIYSRRVSLSASYNYSTGRPVTYPVTSYSIGGIVLTHYSERNKYRIPDYSRLDLSVKISGNLRSDKIAQPHWIFSIYNLTGRNNVYSAYFKSEKNRVNGYYLSVFDRPIPTLSFNFDF